MSLPTTRHLSGTTAGVNNLVQELNNTHDELQQLRNHHRFLHRDDNTQRELQLRNHHSFLHCHVLKNLRKSTVFLHSLHKTRVCGGTCRCCSQERRPLSGVPTPLREQLECPQSVDELNLRQDEQIGLLELKLHDHVFILVDDLLCGTSTAPVCCVNLVWLHTDRSSRVCGSQAVVRPPEQETQACISRLLMP